MFEGSRHGTEKLSELLKHFVAIKCIKLVEKMSLLKRKHTQERKEFEPCLLKRKKEEKKKNEKNLNLVEVL